MGYSRIYDQQYDTWGCLRMVDTQMSIITGKMLINHRMQSSLRLTVSKMLYFLDVIGMFCLTHCMIFLGTKQYQFQWCHLFLGIPFFLAPKPNNARCTLLAASPKIMSWMGCQTDIFSLCILLIRCAKLLHVGFKPTCERITTLPKQAVTGLCDDVAIGHCWQTCAIP